MLCWAIQVLYIVANVLPRYSSQRHGDANCSAGVTVKCDLVKEGGSEERSRLKRHPCIYKSNKKNKIVHKSASAPCFLCAAIGLLCSLIYYILTIVFRTGSCRSGDTGYGLDRLHSFYIILNLGKIILLPKMTSARTRTHTQYMYTPEPKTQIVYWSDPSLLNQ